MATYYVDPAAGGLDNGSSWTDAWTSLASAIAAWAAGDTTYCRGSETIDATTHAAGLTDAAAATGTSAGQIRIIGCDSSGNPGGDRFTLTGDVADQPTSLIAFTAGLNNITFQFIDFDGTNVTGDVVSVTTAYCQQWVLADCIIHDGPGNGLNASHMRESLILGCEICDNSSGGIVNLGSYSHIVESIIRDNGAHGINNLGTACTLSECMVTGNAWAGVISSSDALAYHHCVFDDNGVANIKISATGQSVSIRYCRITNAGTYGIHQVSTDECLTNIEDHNVFAGNITADRLNIAIGANSISAAADGYRDQTGGDLTLVPAAAGRRMAIAMPDGIHTLHATAGLAAANLGPQVGPFATAWR